MTEKQEPMVRTVMVDSVLVAASRTKVLATEVGVRLHYDIPWSKFRYCRSYMSDEFSAEVWEFSTIPFWKEA